MVAPDGAAATPRSRIGVVLNPNARGVRRRRGLGPRLRAQLGADGELAETRSADELARAIDRFADHGCDIVATCGGDGTHLSVLTALVRRARAQSTPCPLPGYAILRGGNVNTVASALGIDGAPEALLAGLLDRLRRGEPLRERGQDLIEVNGLHGFLFAMAMGARFLAAYYRGPLQLGPAWAAALCARAVLSTALAGPFARQLFEPLPMRLVGDGERLPIAAARFVVAATIPTVGVGFRVPWRGGQQPRCFHLVASALALSTMARQLPRVLTGRPLVAAPGGPPHVDRLLRELTIELASEEPYTLDGDLYRAANLTLRVGPRIQIVSG